jgi:hypothetical protein
MNIYNKDHRKAKTEEYLHEYVSLYL